MNYYNLLYKKAVETRKWCEKIRHQKLQRYFPEDLHGMCAIASYKLFKKLNRCRLDPIFVCVNMGLSYHCFILCKNFIIDVTATQFYGNANVVVIPLHCAESQKIYWSYGNFNKTSLLLNNMKDIKKIISYNDWDYQSPFDKHGKERYKITKSS